MGAARLHFHKGDHCHQLLQHRSQILERSREKFFFIYLYVSLCVVCSSYMCIFVQEVETPGIDSKNARSIEGGGAAAVDVEEGGTKHGEDTYQTCMHTNST